MTITSADPNEPRADDTLEAAPVPSIIAPMKDATARVSEEACQQASAVQRPDPVTEPELQTCGLGFVEELQETAPENEGEVLLKEPEASAEENVVVVDESPIRDPCVDPQSPIELHAGSLPILTVVEDRTASTGTRGPA